MPNTLIITNTSPLRGHCSVPGDKSISHRAVIFGSIGDGDTIIRGFLDGGDCRSTVHVMRCLGVEILEHTPTDLTVRGRGIDGLVEPTDVLDCGNSGTTMRLLTGLLAGQAFSSVLNGTSQIRGRPMDRVVKPLRSMGAVILGRKNGRFAPLSLSGEGLDGGGLHAIDYPMPVASAQVKSCLLLAGLYAKGLTIVREPGPARDHTERMLRAMGAPIKVWGNTLHSERPQSPLKPLNLTIPGDMSSAAFLIAAAAIVPGSHITIRGVGVNPTRTGLVDALQEMGAQIRYLNPRDESGEPVADVEIQASDLRGITVGGRQIVTMIDELPTLALAATQAHGRTIIKDAQELRVKETDRIATTVQELRNLGAKIEATPDGMIIDGPTPLFGGHGDSHGDHRLAMALAVAGLISTGPITIHNAEVTADSFPGFAGTLRALGASVDGVDGVDG